MGNSSRLRKRAIKIGAHEWQIPILSLNLGLGHVRSLDLSDDMWNFFYNNCTDQAIWTGEMAGIETIDADGITTPNALSDYLNSL